MISNQPTLGRILQTSEVQAENLAMENVVPLIASEWLWTNYSHIGGKPGETHDISEIAESFAVKDEQLFRESLQCLSEEYAVTDGEKIHFKKVAPVGCAVSQLYTEPVQEFAQNFAIFLDFVRNGFDRQILGVTDANFDPGAWEQVLGGPFYLNDRRRALEFGQVYQFISKKAPIRILDFGCGTGHSAIQLQGYFEALGMETEIYGSDPMPGMVAAAIKRVPSLKPYIPGDPMNTTKFDIVFASHCFHYIPEDKRQPTMALLDSMLESPGKILGCGLFSDYTPNVGTVIKILGGAGGAPSAEEFKDWFTGTSFTHVRVNPQERVFAIEK